MGYFDPQSSIEKIREETGISNVAPKASVRAAQPVQTAAQKAAAKRAKQRQYFIDAGEGIPPHLK